MQIIYAIGNSLVFHEYWLIRYWQEWNALHILLWLGPTKVCGLLSRTLDIVEVLMWLIRFWGSGSFPDHRYSALMNPWHARHSSVRLDLTREKMSGESGPQNCHSVKREKIQYLKMICRYYNNNLSIQPWKRSNYDSKLILRLTTVSKLHSYCGHCNL